MAEENYTDASNRKPSDVPVNELTKAIDGIDFPANKNDLVQQAQKNNAPDTVVQAIRKLPGERFETMINVTKAYGELDEREG